MESYGTVNQRGKGAAAGVGALCVGGQCLQLECEQLRWKRVEESLVQVRAALGCSEHGEQPYPHLPLSRDERVFASQALRVLLYLCQSCSKISLLLQYLGAVSLYNRGSL